MVDRIVHQENFVAVIASANSTINPVLHNIQH